MKMDNKEEMRLDYTDDFKIACKINNVSHEELLQYFIDHVSFYAFIGGQLEDAHQWSTTVCMDCKAFWGSSAASLKDDRIRDVSLAYIKALTALTQETALSCEQQVAKSKMLMREWEGEMLPLVDYPSSFQLYMGGRLTLSFDFNLLCRMNGVDQLVLLQYFVDSISLARERALNLSGEVKTAASTAVLMTLVCAHEEFKQKILPRQDIYRTYGLQLLKLDKRLKGESDIESRMNNYSDFYREWYHALLAG